MATKHKVFISYHHANDQSYKNDLVSFSDKHDIFIDMSVDTGDIDETLDDQAIRAKIRDEYLRDSTVTILLVGTETKYRKHVDWELYSSMIDGSVNKKSGVLVILLPTVSDSTYTAAHGDEEKATVYPSETSWTTVDSRTEYERRYPSLPDRIIDNLLTHKAKISVAPWSKLNDETLRYLVDATFEDRQKAEYDLSRTMRRRNG